MSGTVLGGDTSGDPAASSKGECEAATLTVSLSVLSQLIRNVAAVSRTGREVTGVGLQHEPDGATQLVVLFDDGLAPASQRIH